MLALYIFLGILLCLFLLLMLRIRVVLTCDTEVRADLRILFLRFSLYPRKKKKIRIRDYSYKRYRKRLEKSRKNSQKKKKENAARKEKPKIPLRRRISLFVSLFDGIYGRFLRYFRIDIARLRIDVATGDAAKTAILTGVVSQSVAYLCAVLDQHTNLGRTYSAEIAVQPNFLEEHSRVEGKFVFSLRVIRLLELGTRFAFNFLKQKITQKNAITNTEGE